MLQMLSISTCDSINQNANNTSITCPTCVDSGCYWCGDLKTCVQSTSDCTSGITDTCNEVTLTIVFAVVLAFLLLICLLTCYARRHYEGRTRSLFNPLLSQYTRQLIWRNSLIDEGEYEWMCVICGFDNKPRNKLCTLCGTSHDFSLQYKSEKKEQRKTKHIKEIKTSSNSKANNKDDDLLPLLNNSNNLLDDSNNNNNNNNNNNDDSDEVSSLKSYEWPSRAVLSPAQRREAFNYRRLNILSLRQKIARRRRMWQRTMDENGNLKWIRVPVGETLVGDSPMGYTPRHSLSDTANNYSINTSGYDAINSLIQATMNSNSSPYANSNYPRQDSFGDSTLLSSSPGYTSVLDDDGHISWEKVESGKPATTSVLPRSPSFIDTGFRNNSEETIKDQVDLQAIAALTYKEKQFWFLEQMSKLQKPWSEGCVRIELRRTHILQDSLDKVVGLGKGDLHKWMRIVFIGEKGVDAGGLEREWFALTTDVLLDPRSHLFTYNAGENVSGGSSNINPASGVLMPDHLKYFRFAGRFFGKAIMEQQAIPAMLSLPLRKQILSVPITFSDLEFVDLELYRNLIWLKNNSNVETLGLDFTVTYASPLGKAMTFELVPGGSDITVTDENKSEYLQLRLKHRMLDSIKPQLESFLRGIYEVVPPDLLSVFDYQELELLMCGIEDLDVDDWMRHTEYLGEYIRLGAKHKVISWFWQSVKGMSAEERVKLLQFTTGCSRLPAQGFKALQSNDGKYRMFNIQSITRDKHSHLYPRAHTCFNKLDLPLYKSREELDAYLSVVINGEVTGFSIE